MSRDMDLVRKIILACDAVQPGAAMPDVPTIEGHSETEVKYHVHLMGQAGLLQTADAQGLEDLSPQAVVCSVTWKGHEFADAAKSSAVWNKTKQAIGKAGGATFDVMLDLLKAYGKQQLAKHTGIELG